MKKKLLALMMILGLVITQIPETSTLAATIDGTGDPTPAATCTVAFDANGGSITTPAYELNAGDILNIEPFSDEIHLFNKNDWQSFNKWNEFIPPAGKQLAGIEIEGTTVLLTDPSYDLTVNENKIIKLLWYDEITTATVTINPPAAGTASSAVNTSTFATVPGGANYTAQFTEWRANMDPGGPTWNGTFEDGNTYVALVTITANNGYCLGWPGLIGLGNYITVENATYLQAIRNDGAPISSVGFLISFTPSAAPTETVGMHVWTPGHGKVMINGSDYGTNFQGTWFPGTQVQIEAVPDPGYKFNRWIIRSASDTTRAVTDTSAALVAGTDTDAVATFGLEKASITITPPSAGETTATLPQITVPADAGYSVNADNWGGVWWADDASQTMMPPWRENQITFEAGKTYYAHVSLRDGADSFAAQAGGSSFDTELSVTGGTMEWQANSAHTAADESVYLQIDAVIAVTVPDNTEPVHVHTLVKTEKVEPGCETSGTEAYWTCSECKKMFSDSNATAEITAPVAIPATGHVWDNGTVTKAATCTEKGVKTFTCKNDATHTKTEEVAALGHSWDEGVVTTEPTCTEKGVKTFTCKNDATHTKTEEVAALGHDWSEWKIVKEATETEDGEETRSCSRCKETEVRVIPHLVVKYRNTEGDGNTWEKGSTESLTFVFKRSVNDETTFSHFTGIQVDGAAVDASNYEAVSGSVKITVKPGYLGTLTAGKHAIAVMFDDADAATASFTVTEKPAPTPAPTTAPTPTATPGNKVPDTGDSNNVWIWGILFMASLLGLLVTTNRRSRNDR